VEISEQGQNLLDLLVRKINSGEFKPGTPHTYIGYKDAHIALGLTQQGLTWGRSLKQQGLNDLAHWVAEKKLPTITGLIVDTSDGYRPSDGYFGYYNNGVKDDVWWREEVRKALRFDWSEHSSAEILPTGSELTGYDLEVSEGKEHMVEVRQRERCGKLIKRAKEYFRGADGILRCKVCGWHRPDRILFDIVEIHHTQPLNELPAVGRSLTIGEALDQLVPLCPNCHRVIHSRLDHPFTVDELRRMIRAK
jgi:ribosomal protein L37AE/L43A